MKPTTTEGEIAHRADEVSAKATSWPESIDDVEDDRVGDGNLGQEAGASRPVGAATAGRHPGALTG